MEYQDTEQLIIELKKIMLEKQISQKDLAAKIGLTPQGFVKLLNKKNFSFDDMSKILNALNYNLNVSFINKAD